MTTAKPLTKKAERKLAASLFNRTWKLLRAKKRTEEADEAMANMAHASLYHWSQVGTPVNLAIGEWQVSHVYAMLGRAEPALFHARSCLRTCRKNGVGDFPLAYAYEAMARACLVAGRRSDYSRYLDLARRAGDGISESDDRKHFMKDLKALSTS